MIYTDVANPDYKVKITNVSLWLSHIKLNPEAQAKYLKFALNPDLNQTIEWTAPRMRESNALNDINGTVHVKTTTDEIISIYVIPQYLDRENTADKNNMVFDHLDLTRCYIRVNDTMFPMLDCGVSFKEGKRIDNVEDPQEDLNAVNSRYLKQNLLPLSEKITALEENSLTLKDDKCDGKGKTISNIEDPIDKKDVFTKSHLDYHCILWENGHYFARNEHISGIKDPVSDSDAVNKKIFQNTIAVEDSGKVQFSKFSRNFLIDKMELSIDMFMKISVTFIFNEDDMQRKQIKNLADPIESHDAVHKKIDINLVKDKDSDILYFERLKDRNPIILIANGKRDYQLQMIIEPIENDEIFKTKPYIYIEKLSEITL
ncbi:uncharacterized protein TNCT_399711 [Trichonephila clavata]|uniref:Uncharacterized protein n=1 Tax=Trichonephila clavata TaxID=2740835 RepID=A0A8X6FDI8_TRICU|nr:uncharacterized protein TNCT_399711 [Trichonephila clavata]